MDMYRVRAVSRFDAAIVYSPFVFEKADAEERCRKANKAFRMSKHYIRLDGNYKPKEVWSNLPEDVSIQELKGVIQSIKRKDTLWPNEKE